MTLKLNKQPVYIIDKQSIHDIVDLAVNKGYRGYHFGEKTPEEIKSSIDAELVPNDDGFIHISKAANLLVTFETDKLIGEANNGLGFIIKEMNKQRKLLNVVDSDSK